MLTTQIGGWLSIRAASSPLFLNLFNYEEKMPKMKTKSSVKKRFKLTASGKVVSGQAGKRHGMIKRTQKQIRNHRGTTVLAEADGRKIRGWMPYGS